MNRNGIDDQINDNNTDEPQDILEENVDNYDQKKLIIFPVYYDIKKFIVKNIKIMSFIYNFAYKALIELC